MLGLFDTTEKKKKNPKEDSMLLRVLLHHFEMKELVLQRGQLMLGVANAFLFTAD